MDFWHQVLVYVLLFAAGLIAGAVNTVAGAGSLLTLPALIFAGVPGVAANATNRIGIVVQGLTAVGEFHRRRVRENHLSWRLVVAGLGGAVLGAILAARIPDDQFEFLLGILMIVLLVLIVKSPKPHLLDNGAPEDAWSPLGTGRRAAVLGVFFLLGIYAGFLQAGVGIMILLALGYLVRLDLVRGNYIKLLFTLVHNAIAFGVFLFQGVDIAWVAGGVLTAGQALGALGGAWVAIHGGDRWIRIVMVVMVLASSAKLLGLVDFVMGWVR
ncbi:MAG: sulfite exporter TauE/SafE family protein [Candidatus Sumerlaeaceae bacterium]|nr:sulfite exporter TauE/SafE family protein [Candidatus Sumerlaeaceae bacterium]